MGGIFAEDALSAMSGDHQLEKIDTEEWRAEV